MKGKHLFTDDDRGVSPVIGVILMVAITVILAAVIASFVIGLGDDNQTTAPTTSFDADYDSGSPNTLTISMQSGESLNSDDVYIRGSVDGSTDIDASWTSLRSGGASDLSSGNSITLDNSNGPAEPSGDYDVTVVWEDPDSDQSFELNEFSGS